MAKFKQGDKRPANSGIQKGQKQLRTIIRNSVETILASKSKHPVNELMKLIESEQLKPEMQAKVWLELLQYVSPKLSAQAISIDDGRDKNEEDPIDVTPVSTDELLKKANEESE